jgi:hypothetical protein
MSIRDMATIGVDSNAEICHPMASGNSIYAISMYGLKKAVQIKSISSVVMEQREPVMVRYVGHPIHEPYLL